MTEWVVECLYNAIDVSMNDEWWMMDDDICFSDAIIFPLVTLVCIFINPIILSMCVYAVGVECWIFAN